MEFRLSAPATEPVSVTFRTHDGSAVHRRDYTRTLASVVFPPGETVATVSIPIRNDTRPEPLEWFQVEITAATNALISRRHSTARVYIFDND